MRSSESTSPSRARLATPRTLDEPLQLDPVSEHRPLTPAKWSKTQQRSVMSLDDVRAVMAAATTIDPAALLALRIAAVAGAR